VRKNQSEIPRCARNDRLDRFLSILLKLGRSSQDVVSSKGARNAIKASDSFQLGFIQHQRSLDYQIG